VSVIKFFHEISHILHKDRVLRPGSEQIAKTILYLCNYSRIIRSQRFAAS